MTEEQILEGNKLIAEFMGEMVLPIKESDLYPLIQGELGLKQKTRYHTSWDWLMPVYLKIIKQELYANDDTGIVLFNIMYDRLADGDGLIEVYNSIIEFIKWYNSNVLSK